MIIHNRLMVLLDIAIYFATTLGFAAFWHLLWLSDTYTDLNYPSPAEADVTLGALAIFTQAVVLALTIDWIVQQSQNRAAILRVVGLAFVFLWSSHVVGDAAKCGFLPKTDFLALESAYLVIQFVIYGAVMWLAHSLWDRRLRT